MHMQTAKQTTRYADLPGRQAVVVAAFLVAATAVCLAVSLMKQNPFLSAQQGGRDLQVYRNIVTRVHAGESYYDAAGQELRTNGYPTGSLFNWRPPTYAWVIGRLPCGDHLEAAHQHSGADLGTGGSLHLGSDHAVACL